MGTYSITITQAPDKASVVRLVREVSTLGVAEITSRIGSHKPVAEFDTRSFPIERDTAEGIAGQQARIRNFLAALDLSGATAVIHHHAGEITECVTPEMLSNLFEAELQALEQEHD